MTVSVLICTYNRHELLRKALQSILVDAIEKPDQLVIVNGGTSEADSVVESFQQTSQVEVRLIRTININLANSRNIGLRECQGDIIAMTDDDAEIFPDWITKIRALHAELPHAGAIGGAVLGKNVHGLAGRVADLITFPNWPERRSVRTLPGVNISYKRIALERVGEQDVSLFRGEDVDFNWRVKQLGYEIIFDPALKVWHFHRPTLRGIIRQQYMYGRAYYLVRRKWPEMYCIYPHSIRSLKDVLKIAYVLLGPAIDPVISARKYRPYRELPLVYAALCIAGFGWRYGMLRQKLLEMKQSNR